MSFRETFLVVLVLVMIRDGLELLILDEIAWLYCGIRKLGMLLGALFRVILKILNTQSQSCVFTWW